MSKSPKVVSHMARRFTTDAQVRSIFGNHTWATAEFVSDITTHKQLATSMLLDPSCASVFDYCPLSASTNHLKSSEVAAAALSVRQASLQPEAREKSKVLHRIKFPNSASGAAIAQSSEVVIVVSEYSVPVAYKLIGEIPNAQENESEYVVRIIWEKHCCARASGTIVACEDELQQSDLTFINIVQKLQDEKAEKEGDPLPIVFALSSFIMSTRRLRPGKIPDDIRAFLTCDEMGVDVQVVNAVENTLPNRTSASALHQKDFVRQTITEQHLSDALNSAFATVAVPVQDMPPLTESDGDETED